MKKEKIRMTDYDKRIKAMKDVKDILKDLSQSDSFNVLFLMIATMASMMIDSSDKDVCEENIEEIERTCEALIDGMRKQQALKVYDIPTVH